jgi:hypothetical protein
MPLEYIKTYHIANVNGNGRRVGLDERFRDAEDLVEMVEVELNGSLIGRNILTVEKKVETGRWRALALCIRVKDHLHFRVHIEFEISLFANL